MQPLNERRNKQKGRWHSYKRKTLTVAAKKSFVAELSYQQLDFSPNVGELSLNLANSPLSEKWVFTEKIGIH